MQASRGAARQIRFVVCSCSVSITVVSCDLMNRGFKGRSMNLCQKLFYSIQGGSITSQMGT